MSKQVKRVKTNKLSSTKQIKEVKTNKSPLTKQSETNKLLHKNKDITREQKLTALNFNTNITKDLLDDKTLDALYDKKDEVVNKTPKKNNKYYHITKPKCDKVDKDHIKYISLLKFLNALLSELSESVCTSKLVSLGKDTINEITEFKNIPKEEIVKPKYDKLINKHLDEMIKAFGRTKLHIRMRPTIKEYMISILRSMVTWCGYSFAIIQSKKLSIVTTNTYSHNLFYLYCIID